MIDTCVDETLRVNTIESYARHAYQVPLLTGQQEVELTTRFYETKDPRAAEQLVTSHLRVVVSYAREYLGYGLPFADLIQEGSVGLMKAINRYDPNRGVRLVTFATPWIKAEIYEYVLKNWRILKVATTKAQRKLFFNLRSMKSKNGKALTSAEVEHIATTLNVSQADVREMDNRMYGRDVAFEAEDDDGDDAAFAPIDYLVAEGDEPSEQLEQRARESLLGPQLQTALAALDDRSRSIVTARWLDDEPKTLHDLAAVYNISAERVRQIEVNAMKKLRKFLS